MIRVRTWSEGTRGSQQLLVIDDADRVRTVTLDRPEALNAFNEALYDATADALVDAAVDPEVAVVVLTGTGRAFSAGADVADLKAKATGAFVPGRYGFHGLIDVASVFPKPFVCAVNGLAVGVGVTLLGFADLVLVSAEARLRCPFTDLGVAPEAGSSHTFGALLGRQRATWALMSGEWFSGTQCVEMGLAWRVCAPDALLDEATAAARVLARKPISTLIESKRTIVEAHEDAIAAARAREVVAYQRLLGAPANLEALAALAARRSPDFARVDAEHPPDLSAFEALRRPVS